MQILDNLFVYGTLMKRSDGSLHPLIRGRAEYLGTARMPGLLYAVSAYPGAVFADRTGNVHGEAYRLFLPEKTLPILDEYEECTKNFPEPQEYRRRIKTIYLAKNQPCEAWVYLYNWPVIGLKQILSGHFRS